MTKFTSLLAVGSAVTACAWWASAAGDDTQFRVNVDMVQLRAIVTDSAGHYIRTLKPADFRILENGVEQKIRSVITPMQPEASDTSVFVLFDTSNHMYEEFVYAEDAVSNFIHRLAPSDAVAVYGFSRNMTRLAEMSPNRLDAMIGLRKAVSGDDTSLYNAILLTLRDAAKLRGSKVIVVFSNGADNTSQLSPVDVRNVAEDEGIPIYVVSTQDQHAINEIAASTGGKAYLANNWAKQNLAFEAIDADLNNAYVITYYPHSRDDGFHKIDVQILSDNAHHYRIRTRSGYRSEHTE